MGNHIPDRFSLSELIAALIVFTLSVGLGLVTYYIYKAHKIGAAMIFGGLDIILLSGCFDPINTLWLLIPFTLHPLVKRPYSLEQRILRRSGFFIVLLGIIYVCGGDIWFTKIQHWLYHRHQVSKTSSPLAGRTQKPELTQ